MSQPRKKKKVTEDDKTPGERLYSRWIKRLDSEHKAHESWRDNAESACNAFFANGGNAGAVQRRAQITYPLFWSTIKVLHGRIYSQPPKPDVRKRYPDSNGAGTTPNGQPGAQPPQPMGPQGSQAPPAGAMGGQPPPAVGAPPQPAQPTVDDNKLAQTLERGLSYTIDTTEFDADGHMAVNDLLVTALGQAKIEMYTDTESKPVINPANNQPILVDKKTQQPLPFGPDGLQVQIPGVDAIPAMEDVITHQEVCLRHFSWSQFRWEPQQHWSQVSWVAFDHWMTADEIEDQFDVDIAAKGNYPDGGSSKGNADPGDNKPDSDKYKNQFKVSEIWDKKTKTRMFLCEEYKDLLDDPEDDPLGLQDFFPCPKPMVLNVKGDDFLPMPDYTYCESLFDYCNNLNNRIMLLTKQIKDQGFYDAGFPELGQLINQLDGNLIPIKNLGARLAALGSDALGKGYDAVVCKQDNSGKVEVVQSMMQLGDLAKQKIWEIYGVADIQRGSTDPNETATAQNIKAEWANIRVGERIRIVALFFRDVFRIMAEIMAEKFEPHILEQMTGIQLNPQELEVLRSDYGRCYVIDVESDSTIVQDEFAQKQQRIEFLNTVTGYIEKIMPAIQQNMLPADLAKELLLFAINTFKDGRQLEQSINNLPTTAAQLASLQTRVTQAMQQSEQQQKQIQDQQKALQAFDAQKNQRENVKTGADVQQKQADTVETQVDTAMKAQQIHESSLKPVPTGQPAAVVPIR